MNGSAHDRARIDAILAERARELARPAVTVETVSEAEIVTFSCGNERYAIEARYVFRLERMSQVTPLPGAPRQFAGITNLHGTLVPLVELGALLNAPVCANPAFVVVLGDRRAEIGLVADELHEMRGIPRDALGAAPAGPRSLVRHITSDGTAVIDGAAIIADPRLTVGDADTPHQENAG